MVDDVKAMLAPKSRSRRKILGAALKAFSSRGFHDTRMEDIAGIAGVAKGTLYYNFSSKAELFAALVSEGMDRFIELLNQDVVSELPFPEYFRGLVLLHVDLLLKWRDLFVIAANPVAHGFDPEVVERVEAARDRYVDYAAGVIRHGQDAGYLRACDPELVAAQVLGLLDGILRHQRRVGTPLSREVLAVELHALLTQGLVAPRLARGDAGSESVTTSAQGTVRPG